MQKYEVKQENSRFWVNDIQYESVSFGDFYNNCGIGVMYGFIDLLMSKSGSKKLKAIMEHAHDWLKHDENYGAIVCVLGDAYYKKHKDMLKLGFRCVAKYRNWAHEAPGSQRCYILKIK